MDLTVRTVGYQTEDHSWLGSAHGTEATDKIVLDLSLFTAGTHYPNGFIPSGMTVAKVTTAGANQGMYGPYNNALTNGQEVLAGHLYTNVAVNTGSTRAAGALLNHGKVREANLPANHGLDAAGKTDVAGRIQYK
ncbi:MULTISPECIES: hypothetical protein [unclassified Micromonospora]|uniref:hypothetical protein n=1 Tax=unclassified Micromonospora TaxID=2617518 RepID=UPI00331C5D17